MSESDGAAPQGQKLRDCLMLDALKAVEWSGMVDREDGGFDSACPYCDRAKRDGEHDPSCLLDNAITKAVAEVGEEGSDKTEIVRFARYDRTIAEMDREEFLRLTKLFGLSYVEASGGLYVPLCDLEQYEAGNRPMVDE